MFAYLFESFIKIVVVISLVLWSTATILINWIMNFPILVIFIVLLPFAAVKAYLEKWYRAE
jgi:hypothetical protein